MLNCIVMKTFGILMHFCWWRKFTSRKMQDLPFTPSRPMDSICMCMSQLSMEACTSSELETVEPSLGNFILKNPFIFLSELNFRKSTGSTWKENFTSSAQQKIHQISILTHQRISRKWEVFNWHANHFSDIMFYWHWTETPSSWQTVSIFISLERG